MFLFDNAKNNGWDRLTGTMVQPDGPGNGFGINMLGPKGGAHMVVTTIHAAGVSG